MSQDYEITLPNDAGLWIGINMDRVTMDGYDTFQEIHLYLEPEKAREIAAALTAAADKLDGLAKESKQ